MPEPASNTSHNRTLRPAQEARDGLLFTGTQACLRKHAWVPVTIGYFKCPPDSMSIAAADPSVHTADSACVPNKLSIVGRGAASDSSIPILRIFHPLDQSPPSSAGPLISCNL